MEVFVNLRSVESYLSLDAIAQALRGYRVRWRSTAARTRTLLAVGMLRERACDPVRQAYQLGIHQTYAKLRGLPLAVPSDEVESATAEAALAFLARRPSSEAVAPRFLRLCFAAIFDPARRGALHELAVRRLLAEAGGDAQGFSEWPATEREAALEADRAAAVAAGVWSTPCLVDSESREVFIGEDTLELATLQLRRREQGPSEELHASPLPAPRAMSPPPQGLRPLGTPARLEVYVDLKSPYAFLAIEPTYALEEDFNVELVWWPYLLDIKSFLGSAEVGAQDNKVKEGTDQRSSGQWGAVKYAYMNVRRYAAERKPPLTVYGTRKIWDTALVGIAMLFAADAGKLREFQQYLWAPFWRRELDAEDVEAVSAVLRSAGISTDGFKAFMQGAGPQRLADIQQEASRRGVFGVPTYVLDGELFFGREHLPLLRQRLHAAGHAKRDTPDVIASPYLWMRNDLFAGR